MAEIKETIKACLNCIYSKLDWRTLLCIAYDKPVEVPENHHCRKWGNNENKQSD